MDSELTRAVVERHLAAVLGGDAEAMAQDYADGAVLERPDRRYEGRSAIRAYFETVPLRLGTGVVVFEPVDVDGERATVKWRIAGGPSDGALGIDELVVRNGEIVRQVVAVRGRDF